MTEGTCEKALIDVLINKGIFKISVESLLYEDVFKARQIKGSLLEKINQLPFQETITIIRVGDKLSDDLFIPEDVKERIECCLKICIKPEFEILHLIHKEEEKKYLNKYKSKLKPSEYLHNIDCQYEKSYEYNYDYFNNISAFRLKEIIIKYSNIRKGVHKADEGLLEDYIK